MRINLTKNRVKRITLNLFYVVLGVILIALSINMFFLKVKITPGGVSGLATVIYYLTGISVGTVVFAINIPLFIAGFFAFGKRYSVKTLFATLLLSVVLDTTTFLPQVTDDMLLAAIFGGLLMGAGMALVFKGGATTGGTDVAAKLVIKYFPRFNISEQLFFIDGLVVITAMIAFRNFDVGLYSIITIWISAKVIDLLFEGVGFAKAIFIISDNGDEIADRVMAEVGRGVTGINGEGMYLKTKKKVLLTIADKSQIPTIKFIVKDIDSKAFVFITDVRETLGEGFNK